MLSTTTFTNNIFLIKINPQSYGQNLQYQEREHKKAKKEQDLHKIPGTPGKQNVLLPFVYSQFVFFIRSFQQTNFDD